MLRELRVVSYELKNINIIFENNKQIAGWPRYILMTAFSFVYVPLLALADHDFISLTN